MVTARAMADDDPFPAIPHELKLRPQWVVWRLEKRQPTDLRPTKVPYNPRNLSKARAGDARTWSTYGDACASYQRGGAYRPGVEIDGSDPYTPIDLDHCVDPKTGEIADWALAEVQRFAGTYMEYSPSGEGLHIWTRGQIKQEYLAPGQQGRKVGNYEAYSGKHFFTMTGQQLAGTPATIADRQDELDAFCAEHFSPKAKEVPQRQGRRQRAALMLEDDELVRKARQSNANFAALWNGDTSSYGGDKSRADEALIAHLDFWTGGDAAQIERLMRSSGLYRRDKYDDRDDYLPRSIAAWQRDHTDGAHYGDGVQESPRGRAARDDAGEMSGTEMSTPPVPSGYPLTDYGNAERLRDRHGHDMRYCYAWKTWLVWDGKRWKKDECGQSVLWAKETIRGILGEAEKEPDDKVRKMLVSHEQRSEAEARIRAMLSLAESECAIAPEQLDAPATDWLITCASGTIDLRTGRLRQPRREDYITKLSPAEYDGLETPAPILDSVVARIMGNNAALIAFLQRAAGYSMTGSTREQVFFIPYGKGDNGKSTLLDAFRYVMGSYAEHVRSETLMVKKGEQIPQDIAKLKGARFVSAVETEQGQRLAESLIKELTGDKAVTGRFMRSNEFTFTPTSKIWLATNHRPEIRGTDHAIWRRIRLIPFTVAIPENEKDRDLSDKLQAEAAGILAWMVRGCLAWQREGLGIPEDVRQATNDYRADMDSLGDYLAERTISDPTGRLWAKASDLYADYRTWGERNAEQTISQRAFGRGLGERGYKRDRSNGAHIWRGLGLKDDSDPSDPSDPETDINAHEQDNRRSYSNQGHLGSLGTLNADPVNDVNVGAPGRASLLDVWEFPDYCPKTDTRHHIYNGKPNALGRRTCIGCGDVEQQQQKG